MNTVINVKNISKSYSRGLRALDNVSLKVNQGKVLVIMDHQAQGKAP